MRTIVLVAMLSKNIRSVRLHFCAGSYERKFSFSWGKILYWFQMITHIVGHSSQAGDSTAET